MVRKISLCIESLLAEPRRILLIDGIGAFLTAFLLLAVLAQFDAYVGLPKKVLYFLASIASLFAVYSLGCYLLITKNWRPYVAAISIANLFYCLLTTSLIVYFYKSLTIVGMIYFTLEISIILGLVRIERHLLSQRTAD